MYSVMIFKVKRVQSSLLTKNPSLDSGGKPIVFRPV